MKFDIEVLRQVQRELVRAEMSVATNLRTGIQAMGFTTSPSLGAVAGQYSTYLAGHPGSLQIATQAAVANVGWLHDNLVPMIQALSRQEDTSSVNFQTMMLVTKSEEYNTFYTLPNRPDIPILDLAYTPPVVAIEAGTPLKALTPMFAGSDSGMIAAADSWASASRRMLDASESLGSALSLLAGTTEGSSFQSAQAAIGAVSEQCAVVSTNAQVMSTSMLRLPGIRAEAHAQLVALEVEMAAEATAAGAASGGTGAAAVAAQEQARVALWASTYLQPALDTARPMVTNLAIPVVGHTGGGGLEAGGSATMAANETITQVAGGAAAPGASAPAAQPPASMSQVSQVAATPAGGTQAAPVSATPTAPAGGGMPAAARGGPGASGFTGVQPASIGGTPVVPGRGASTTVPANGVAGPRGTGASGTGAVVQPLLPRSVRGGTPAMPMRGGMTPGFGTGVGSGGGTGVGGGTGATGGRPGGGMGMPGAAPVGSGASGGRPGGAGAPHMMGGAGMGAAGAGQKGKGAVHGRGAVSPFQSAGVGGGARGSKGRSGLSGIQDYFRRQFLGEKPRTVKKVIR